MSYYKGEEVTYIGSIEGDGNPMEFESDILFCNTMGDRYNIKYSYSCSFNKGDIFYVVDSVDFPSGGYFKSKIGCSFSSSFYSFVGDAKAEIYTKIYNETADLVNYGGESVYFEYLGKDFNLSQLTDELPTEAPTQPPTQKPTETPTETPTQPSTEAPTEKPTQPPTEAELPTGGEVLETSYNFSGLTIKNADEIINNSMGVVPSMIVAVVPLAIVAFSIGFGIKKALSYFRTVGRGGH